MEAFISEIEVKIAGMLTLHHNRCMTNLNGCVELSGLETWRVVGPDARTFLHGQLTQDISMLKADQARWSAYCSPKGRALANCLIQQTESDSGPDLWLTLSADLSQPTLQRLRMFVMRAKCTFEVQNNWRVWGVAGNCIPTELPKPIWSRWVDHTRSCVWVRLPAATLLPEDLIAMDTDEKSAEVARALCWTPSSSTLFQDTPLSSQVWKWLEIMAAQPWVTLKLRELYIPQMLNLESIGGVSFKKGCYPGQEVVARSQFRGAVKRKTSRIRFESDSLEDGFEHTHPFPELMDPVTGDVIGEVYLTAMHPYRMHQVDALSIVPIEWTLSEHPDQFHANLRCKHHDVAVQHIGLPYLIRQDL